jgi:hypothetical protein
MRNVIIILALAALYRGPVAAQAANDFSYYNDRTYALYEAGQWDELVTAGRAALRADFDFFYLRLRLGIAYYQLGKYGLAANQFYAARRWNANDPLTLEYLYYSLVFSGRFAEARIFEKQVQQGETAYLGASADLAYKTSDRRTPVAGMEVYNLGFRHPLGTNVALTHTYEYLNQHFIERVVEVVDPPGQGPPGTRVREYRYQTSQQAYGLRGHLQLERGLAIGLAFHHLWGSAFAEQAYWAAVERAMPRLRVKLGAGYTNFNSAEQWQLGLDFTVLPLDHTRLYYQAGLLLNQSGGESQPWVRQRLGFRLAGSVWLEGLADFGEISYFQEADGAVVYNIADPLRARWGGNIQYWLTGNHLLFLQYQVENKTFRTTAVDYTHRGVVVGVNFNL